MLIMSLFTPLWSLQRERHILRAMPLTYAISRPPAVRVHATQRPTPFRHERAASCAHACIFSALLSTLLLLCALFFDAVFRFYARRVFLVAAIFDISPAPRRCRPGAPHAARHIR